jgi:hypothetical protein
MGRRSARINSQDSRISRARRYITCAKNAEQSVDYKTQKKKEEKEDAMVQIEASISPSLWRASFLIMGMAIIGTDTRSGQTMGDPTRPPQGNDSLAVQAMEGATRQPHMNVTRAVQVMGNQASAARRTDERSIEETLVSMIPGVGGVFQLLNSPQLMGDPSRAATDGRSLGETLFAMIPGVGGFFQLFSSPHLYGPISTALRHLGKRDTTRVAPTQASEWNRIHSGTCETDKDCANVSFCAASHTCFPQGRIIMGCIAVVVIIGSGIIACICCPCRGLMGC